LLLGPEYNFFHEITGIYLPGTRPHGDAKKTRPAPSGASGQTQSAQQPHNESVGSGHSAFPNLSPFDSTASGTETKPDPQKK
jgi:hypothetical protein